MARAMAFCEIPMGSRYSFRRISPGVIGLSTCISHDVTGYKSMIVHDGYVVRPLVGPPKRDSPLVIDSIWSEGPPDCPEAVPVDCREERRGRPGYEPDSSESAFSMRRAKCPRSGGCGPCETVGRYPGSRRIESIGVRLESVAGHLVELPLRGCSANQGAQASMAARNLSFAPGPRAKGLMMGRSRPEAR